MAAAFIVGYFDFELNRIKYVSAFTTTLSGVIDLISACMEESTVGGRYSCYRNCFRSVHRNKGVIQEKTANGAMKQSVRIVIILDHSLCDVYCSITCNIRYMIARIFEIYGRFQWYLHSFAEIE